jgi:hypothetical protein
LREFSRRFCDRFPNLLRLRARRRPHAAAPQPAHLRLSRIFRRSETTATDPDAVPLVRVLLWGLFAAVLLVGLVLYFKYERVVLPLLT